VNTARSHLDALVEDGLAARAAEARDGPGRPRTLYSADGPAPGPRAYALLAEMLAGLTSSLDHAGATAVETGKAWGRPLVERAAPSQQVDAEDALARLNRMLDAVGFQPRVRPTEKSTEVGLHHCPFREIAEKHAEVVCAIHLGLMQRAMKELNAPVEAKSLDPFVTPNLCIAYLQSAKAAS
jgi:predicted ArsR family transcriptional regulator